MYKSEIKEYFKQHSEALIQDICRLIKIKSVREAAMDGMPYGQGPAGVLEESEKMAGSMGFSVTNYDNYVLAIDFNDKEKQLDILAHLDVVPEGEGWSITEAYKPVVIDGRLYGRGAIDDKGPAVAALYAMKAIKDLNIPLNKNVRLILGADEECGSSDLSHYYKYESEAPMSISPDAEFPVINLEKGGLGGAITAEYKEDALSSGILKIHGGEKQNVVPGRAHADVFGLSKMQIEESCRKVEELTGLHYIVEEHNDYIHIEVIGETGHAASPQKAKNSVTGIIGLLTSLPLQEGNGFKSLKALGSLFPHGDWTGEAAGIKMRDEISGELTISLNVIDYGPRGFRAVFDSRCPLCANSENMRDVLERSCSQAGLRLEAGSMYPSHYVPEDSILVKTLLKCYKEVTGKEGSCVAIGGGTYVHRLQNGVAFGAAMPEKEYNVHGANEYAEVKELITCAELYAQVILELCC